MEDWETECQCLPGFYTKDGGWKQLPVPENYSVYYSTTNSFLTNAANVITPDGKYIAGQLDVTTGYEEVSGLGLLEKASTVPVLWEKSDTGYVLKAVYTDLWKDSKRLVDGELVTITDSVSFQTFIVWDISDDGQTLVGVNTAGSGGQNPAIIRDGVMIQLFECGEEDAADDRGRDAVAAQEGNLEAQEYADVVDRRGGSECLVDVEIDVHDGDFLC